MKKVHTYLLFFILCCGYTNLHAQKIIIGTNYGTINDNEKMLTKLESEQRRFKASQDTTNLRLSRIEQRMAITDSIYSANIAKRDSVNEVLSKERNLLIYKHSVQNDSIMAKDQQIAQLKSIIQIQKKGNFLPLGIKQIKNNPKALGYTFLVSEIVVPAVWFGSFYSKALNSYDKYENRVALTLEEHNNYYADYKKYRSIAIWGAVGTEVIIYALNVLCNYHCTKIEIKPQSISDLQGNLGIGMSIGIKF